MGKIYTCDCGKTFTNPQSFNGHKCHCKAHLGDEKYQAQLKRDLTASRIGGALKSKQSKEQHIEKVSKWISEQHVCEHCGKVMTEYYGSGKFCSSKCAHARTYSEETKQKIRDSVIKTKNLKPKTLHKCSLCGKILRRESKTGLCFDCLHNTVKGREILSRLATESTKLKIQNGTHVGWQSRNITSYPEQFWMKVLDNNNISYQHNFPVKKADNINNYFLDFYIEINDARIDLEIDGKQHGYEDRKESDKTRNEYLASQGYLIYRIKWNEINSDIGKELMQHKVQQFEQYYNGFR